MILILKIRKRHHFVKTVDCVTVLSSARRLIMFYISTKFHERR